MEMPVTEWAFTSMVVMASASRFARGARGAGERGAIHGNRARRGSAFGAWLGASTR